MSVLEKEMWEDGEGIQGVKRGDIGEGWRDKQIQTGRLERARDSPAKLKAPAADLEGGAGHVPPPFGL